MTSWRLDITVLMKVDTSRDEVTPRCVRPKLAHVDLLDVSESKSERRGIMDLKLRCALLEECKIMKSTCLSPLRGSRK
jgi:hypothetical protein